MLYVKNGILRDSSKYLQTEDGRTIFNASSAQWQAEGWKPYVPDPEPVYEKTVEDLRQELKQDAESYMLSNLELPISREERTHLRILAQDLLEAGYIEARILQDENEKIDLLEFVDYLKALNRTEYFWKETLRGHLANINRLDTEEAVERYDYTTGYTELPELSIKL